MGPHIASDVSSSSNVIPREPAQNSRGRSLRPNVTFKPKQYSDDGKTVIKKKVTLQEMLKNGKKVLKEVGDPLKEKISEGHIPNDFLDEINEGIDFKLTSFSRKLDTVFTYEFGREYHKFRQEAWKKAKVNLEKGRWKPLPSKYLKGTMFAPRDDMVLWEERPPRTYYLDSGSIKLPMPLQQTFNANALEASRIVSGLAKGNVSYNEKVLQYKTSLDFVDQRIYIDELDELKYIYKGFWHLAKSCEKNWLEVLYSKPHNKILDYNLASWTPRDGLLRSEDTVLLSIEGTDIWIQVDKLYEWILHWRTPGKSYAIGECDSEKALLYSILLADAYGIPEDLIKEKISLDDFIRIEWEIKDALNLHVMKGGKDDDSSSGLPEEWTRYMESVKNLQLSTAPKEEEPTFEERALQVNIDLRNIDLSQLDDGEVDSFISSEDEFERNEENFGDPELPYHPNLHASANEYEALYLQLTRGGQEEEEHPIDQEEWPEDDIPDKELTALEELGIDLIDPSRDNTQQPSLRRIGMVWDPGGGIRTLSLRYRK